MADSPLAIVERVAEVLERLGIAYVIGGSLASSAHGQVRTTADADLVIEIASDQTAGLINGLGPGFYVSREAVDEAIRDRRSFNAIHVETLFKLDFFVLGDEPFDREEFRRRTALILETGHPALCVKTPEDTILRKLLWFRDGGETSEQQWRDVLGVLALRRDALDDAYLDEWATQLGLSEQLGRARREALPG
jgi:hypothetical protein